MHRRAGRLGAASPEFPADVRSRVWRFPGCTPGDNHRVEEERGRKACINLAEVWPDIASTRLAIPVTKQLLSSLDRSDRDRCDTIEADDIITSNIAMVALSLHTESREA